MTYHEDIERAWARMRSIPSRFLETESGTIEYVDEGKGQPVLMSHGIFGSHAEALGMIRTYYGDDAFAIAPSRFGYFGSQLPPHATPALQADVYASLLDDLGINRVVAIGFSAGGPSILEFGLRHPDRVDLLVLLSSALPRKPITRLVTALGAPLMRVFLRDRVMWTFMSLMPRSFQSLIGVPKAFDLSAGELATIREISESMLPVPPRREGVVFDAFVGNPHVNSCSLEEITTPALLIHAVDDGLAPYQTAVDAAVRIPAIRFVSLTGGHEFLGHEGAVQTAIHSALAEVVSTSTHPTSPTVAPGAGA